MLLWLQADQVAGAHITSATGWMKILPSPISPVCDALTIIRHTVSTWVLRRATACWGRLRSVQSRPGGACNKHFRALSRCSAPSCLQGRSPASQGIHTGALRQQPLQLTQIAGIIAWLRMCDRSLSFLHRHAARLVHVRTALHAGALHRRRGHAQDALAAEGPHDHRQPPGTDDGLPHAGDLQLMALAPAGCDADSAGERLASTRKNWVSGKAVMSTLMASTSLSSVPVPFEPAGAELSRPPCARPDRSQCRLQDAAHCLLPLVCSCASLPPGGRAGGSATAAAHCIVQTYTHGSSD